MMVMKRSMAAMMVMIDEAKLRVNPAMEYGGGTWRCPPRTPPLPFQVAPYGVFHLEPRSRGTSKIQSKKEGEGLARCQQQTAEGSLLPHSASIRKAHKPKSVTLISRRP